MTEAEKVQRLARHRIEKGARALEAAQTLLGAALFEDAISRAYYAMFHSASALLLMLGLSTSKHRGVLSLFDMHFVKTGRVDVSLSEWIHGAFKARQEADYGYDPVDAEAAAMETVSNAREFVQRVGPVLDRLVAEASAPPQPSA